MKVKEKDTITLADLQVQGQKEERNNMVLQAKSKWDQPQFWFGRTGFDLSGMKVSLKILLVGVIEVFVLRRAPKQPYAEL